MCYAVKWKYHLSIPSLSLCWCLYDILLRRWRRFNSTSSAHWNDGKFLMFDDDDGAPFDIFIPYFLSLTSLSSLVYSLLLACLLLYMFACFNLLWLFMDIYRMEKLFSSVFLLLFLHLEWFSLTHSWEILEGDISLLLWMMKGIFQGAFSDDDRCQLSKVSS